MYARTERSQIPDAVAAVVAAVVADHPQAGPDAIGRLTVLELAREGWHITPDALLRRAETRVPTTR
jgi:hypothetical protein